MVLCVETHTEKTEPVVPPVLRVETQHCIVKLTRLEAILTDYLKETLTTTATDLPAGQHLTRSGSRLAKSPVRVGRRPRKFSTGIKYTETDDDEKTRSKETSKRVKVKAKPPRSGPTPDRICSRNKRNVSPAIRLPPVTTEGTESSEMEELPTTKPPPIKRTVKTRSTPTVKTRGTFTTKEYILKKKIVIQKYRCRMCKEQLPSCRALTEHHQKEHGIIYCDVCGKAFNNQRSLTKHMYHYTQ